MYELEDHNAKHNVLDFCRLNFHLCSSSCRIERRTFGLSTPHKRGIGYLLRPSYTTPRGEDSAISVHRADRETQRENGAERQTERHVGVGLLAKKIHTP